MLESPVGKYFIMEVLAMKRQIVLKIESEKGKEEYCIDLNHTAWSDVIYELFQSGDGKGLLRKNEIRKQIVLKSSDEDLVRYALGSITTYLTNAELNSLLERFKHSENVQWMLLCYCFDNERKTIIKKIQEEGCTEKICEEAKNFLKN